MKQYKSAILGCGPRAEFHILAYEGLEEVSLAAVCDRDRTRLDDYGEKFSIPNLYENLEEMLEKEKPDILHIVTPPSIRQEPIELAGKAGVKGIIVEKPIALDYPQAKLIQELADKYSLKVAVNMQRRYFRTCQSLRKILTDGTIGDIEFVRCVTKGNILSMGPHLVDLLLFFLDDAMPNHIWSSAYGMNGHEYGHPAPASMLINLKFPKNIVAYIEDSDEAVGTIGEEDGNWETGGYWQHCELDFWGSKGRAWWKQNLNWGYVANGMSEPKIEKSRWEKSDVPGQRDFTRAMGNWLDDDAKIHDNCLTNAMKGFEVILGIFYSALLSKRIEMPTNIPEDIVQQLEAKLS
jgi:predicted dehydrogenase